MLIDALSVLPVRGTGRRRQVLTDIYRYGVSEDIRLVYNIFEVRKWEDYVWME